MRLDGRMSGSEVLQVFQIFRVDRLAANVTLSPCRRQYV